MSNLSELKNYLDDNVDNSKMVEKMKRIYEASLNVNPNDKDVIKRVNERNMAAVSGREILDANERKKMDEEIKKYEDMLKFESEFYGDISEIDNLLILLKRKVDDFNDVKSGVYGKIMNFIEKYNVNDDGTIPLIESSEIQKFGMLINQCKNEIDNVDVKFEFFFK